MDPRQHFETDEPWPLARLYHQNTKLGRHRRREFLERLGEYSEDLYTLREAAHSFKDYATRKQVELPRSPRWKWGKGVRYLLRRRRTRRDRSGRPISKQHWGTLLECAGGLTGQVSHPEDPDLVQTLRAWPSGGGLYPLEVYLVVIDSPDLPPGLYHYCPRLHQLALLNDLPPQESLQQAFFAEGFWSDCCGLVVLTGLLERTMKKYGERGYRVVLLDAGHLSQNLLMMCEDLRIHAIPLGGFDDDAVAAQLGLDDGEVVLHSIMLRGSG